MVTEITRQGRLSELTGLRSPRSLRHLTDATRTMGFWGTFGLCGGMSWAALDRYFTGQPAPTDGVAPLLGSELFSELVRRQVESMRGRKMMARCLTWQVLPDKSPWWLFWTKGVLERTGRQEWPALKESLDRGVPTSLTLIRVAGVADPSDHHQVVATGYEEDGDDIGIRLYDPNHPSSKVSIHLRFDRRGRLQGCSQTTGEPLRGFFTWSYKPPT